VQFTNIATALELSLLRGGAVNFGHSFQVARELIRVLLTYQSQNSYLIEPMLKAVTAWAT